MKVLKFLSMALFAIIMSVGFFACSGDNDIDENGNSTSPDFVTPKMLGKGKTMLYIKAERVWIEV